ncbi:MAG: hypothetical protein KDJ33_01095 [Gammaproteobacteria bacterium]|nr:hypothetical protein [Gammaproteobacteria bacterium]
MCYILLLSTTSDRDLAQFNSELVRFTRVLPKIADAQLLRHAHRWYVASKAGCSCTFRHLHSRDLGFGRPVDWYPEEPDEIDATIELVAVIRSLLDEGEAVDCVDTWQHHEDLPISEARLEIDLSSISDDEFRLFENHHFLFQTGS